MGGEGVGRGRGHRLWVARKANTKVKNDRIVHDTCGVDEEVTVEDDINEKKTNKQKKSSAIDQVQWPTFVSLTAESFFFLFIELECVRLR